MMDDEFVVICQETPNSSVILKLATQITPLYCKVTKSSLKLKRQH
jgi:hypothetical protein